MCYAQGAADSATDPVYADGWQAGDNGGFGYGPWDFTGTYNTPVGQVLDTTSRYNPFDAAWTLFNADAPPGPGIGTDIAQAGRRILGNLQPGQTVSILLANPLQRRFFRGYTVRFNTGGGNTRFMEPPQSRMAIGTFEYFTNGKWFATGTGGDPTIFDLDSYAGMKIDFTLNTINTFSLTMTTLNNDSETFTKSGTLDGPAGAPIDWIEFELYNTDSDFSPTEVAFPEATDFYIASMIVSPVIPEPHTACMVLVGAAGVFLAVRARRREE
jgi:PEP-CTERM motif-containing protein